MRTKGSKENMLKMSQSHEKITILILTGFILLLAICIGFLAAVPPVSRDALTHHLAIPKLYLQHGGIFELSHIPFSYYPMNLDLLYLIPLYFGNDVLPKYIHFLFALFTAGLLYWYLKNRLSTSYALFTALFFLSMPVIVKLSITVYVDLGLVFFSAAALIYLLVWAESKYKAKYLLLSAISCGLALGTKYNGLVILFLLTLLTPILYLRNEREHPFAQSKAIGYAGFFLIIAILVFSPWMIRNAIWTGNPIYPLYNRYFQGVVVDETEVVPVEIQKQANYQVGHWNHFSIRRTMFKESWPEIALIPIRIFFQGQDDKPQFFDGKLNPFLLILPLLIFLPVYQRSFRLNQDLKILAVFVVLFMLIAFLKTSIRIRYIAPIIPPLVILSAYGCRNLELFFAERGRPFFGRCLLYIFIIVAICMNLYYVVYQFRIVEPFKYLSGEVSRDGYITKYRPEYPLVTHANQHLNEENTILALFMGNRIYYSDRHMESGEKWFTQSVLQADSVMEIREKLLNKGFTHILANMSLIKQWLKTFEPPDQVKVVDFFTYHVRLIKQNQSFAFFEVVSYTQ
jgi:4-amino-4-deoxy-L-arabinose transferase-like glycosyltransferase